MRTRGGLALGAALLLAGCGMLGGKEKPEAPPDSENLITKPVGPGLVSRCPVPKAYDDETTHKIQQAIDGLPPDNVLRSVMKDYESERDDLRMCQ